MKPKEYRRWMNGLIRQALEEPRIDVDERTLSERLLTDAQRANIWIVHEFVCRYISAFIRRAKIEGDDRISNMKFQRDIA